MHETPICSDFTDKPHSGEERDNDCFIRNTGPEKTLFLVVLNSTTDGARLSPMIILGGKHCLREYISQWYYIVHINPKSSWIKIDF